MKNLLSNQPIAVKVALAPAVVLLCLLVLAAMGRLGSQGSQLALQRISQSALPEVIEAQALKLHTAELDGLVTRSLAYEGSGMKAKRIEQLDKDIAKRFDLAVAELARLKTAARPDERERFAQMEASLAKFRRMALETLDMKSGGLSAAAMLMNSSEKEYEVLARLVDSRCRPCRPAPAPRPTRPSPPARVPTRWPRPPSWPQCCCRWA